MARVHGKQACIYLDTFNVSGYANTWVLNITSDTADVTAAADTAKEYVVGDCDANADWNAFIGTDDNSYDETAWDDMIGTGGLRYLGLYPHTGTTAAGVAYELYGYVTVQPREAPVDGAIMLNGTIQANKAVSRGNVLKSTALSATGTAAGVNVGAVAAGHLTVATYRVLAVTGSAQVVIDIEHSDDNGVGDAYAAIAALQYDVNPCAVAVVRKTTTGATKAYKRINVTTFGVDAATILITVTQQ